MNKTEIILAAALPVFAIALLGVFLRKADWLSEEADRSLLRLTVNVLAPCLVFDSIMRNEALKHLGTLTLAPVLGFAGVAFGIGVGLLLARGWAGLRDRAAASTFAVCVGLFNYTYLPIPLAQSLFNRDTIGVLFVYNLGVDISMWTLALMLLSGGAIGRDWRRLFNGPVISILVSLALNLSGGERLIPEFVKRSIAMLGQCSVPMGVLLVGAIIADSARDFHSRSGWRVILSGCVLRLGVLPLVAILLARFLPCSLDLKRILVLQGAMPSAVFPIVLTKHYAGDPPTAMRVVIGTSVAGLVTIPLWLGFGLRLVEP